MRTLPVGLRLLQLAGAVEAKKKKKRKEKGGFTDFFGGVRVDCATVINIL
jgi:hypothetical protein